jgi:hypothetical protein
VPKRLSALCMSVLCLLTLISFAAGADADMSNPSLSCQLGPTSQPVAQQPLPFRATYNIDIYRGMAVVTLVQEFSNRSEDDMLIGYRCEMQAAAQFNKLEIGASGIRQALRSTIAPAEETAATAETSFETTWHHTLLEADPFEVAAEEPIVLSTVIRMPLPVEGRLFKLSLPTLQTGTIDDTPDASSASPTTAPLPVQILVSVHHDRPLFDLKSSTHQLLSNFVGDRTLVETVQREIPGTERFELEFALNAADAPTVATYVRTGPKGRKGIEAVLTPPEVNRSDTVRPKQVLFIVDRSGSMSHEDKLVQARNAVAYCIEALEPTDSFNILKFNNKFALLNPEPVNLQEFGMDAVNEWLGALTPGGGTTLLPALAATLQQPDDPDRHRMIVLVTDGFLADEKDVLALLEEELDEGRLFVVGTGTKVNRRTLLTLAEHGKGAATFAGDSQSLETAVTELFDSISQPVGWDLDFGLRAAGAVEITPSRIPDLYTGRGVRVMAWFQDELPSELKIKMTTMTGEQHFSVTLPAR